MLEGDSVTGLKWARIGHPAGTLLGANSQLARASLGSSPACIYAALPLLIL